ncbi:MAG TPA: hypothetical protein VE987_20325 [Polyangiaceae bacterium]|nr:hypothetical protein [Polyangiaceae bacterium]
MRRSQPASTGSLRPSYANTRSWPSTSAPLDAPSPSALIDRAVAAALRARRAARTSGATARHPTATSTSVVTLDVSCPSAQRLLDQARGVSHQPLDVRGGGGEGNDG